MVGGLLAGLQSDQESEPGKIATKTKKLALKLGDNVKLRIQYDFRNDKTPSPDAVPGIGFPGAPSLKGNVGLEIRF